MFRVKQRSPVKLSGFLSLFMLAPFCFYRCDGENVLFPGDLFSTSTKNALSLFSHSSAPSLFWDQAASFLFFSPLVFLLSISVSFLNLLLHTLLPD